MKEDPALVRAFVALELPEDLRERIGRLQAELKRRAKGPRWVGPEALHLTLRFLGQASGPQLAEMGAALEAASTAFPPTRARVSGLGIFPERGQPRVLWLGIGAAPEVLDMQAALESAAVKAGFAPEPRAFRPHLTLGRWRERAPRPSLPPFDLGDAVLDTLTLFRSDLGRGGAVHTPLRSFTLASKAP